MRRFDLLRAVLEGSVAMSIGGIALALTEGWLALLLTFILAALGGVVWLVRLEGRIALHSEMLKERQREVAERATDLREAMNSLRQETVRQHGELRDELSRLRGPQ